MSKEQKMQLIKTFADTFRWEQDYYHRNIADSGRPIGEKKFNRYENGVKVYYSKEQFLQKVKEYADSLGQL